MLPNLPQNQNTETEKMDQDIVTSLLQHPDKKSELRGEIFVRSIS